MSIISIITHKISVLGGLALCCGLSAQLAAVEVPNGSFEHGVHNWKAEGDATLVQDKQVAHAGNASLLFQSDNTESKNNRVVMTLDITDENSFDFSCALKAEGENISGAVGIMALKDSTPVGGWQHIAGIYAHDWKEYTKNISIPDGADKIMIILTTNGKGKAWLDSVSGGAAAVHNGPVQLTAEDISKYSGDIPTVTNIAALNKNTIAVEVREFKMILGKLTPYVKQEGDEIINKK
ncbi:MAG: carbohydrate binding domain-containing protein, partial [Planctomycetes bacterium]|nr:carbohydrate binding domain-containing protein [Planctomycetota bacterium]